MLFPVLLLALLHNFSIIAGVSEIPECGKTSDSEIIRDEYPAQAYSLEAISAEIITETISENLWHFGKEVRLQLYINAVAIPDKAGVSSAFLLIKKGILKQQLFPFHFFW